VTGTRRNMLSMRDGPKAVGAGTAASGVSGLTRDDVEAIAAATAQAVADRVLDLIDARQTNRLVDARELADVLGVDRDWIYAHADQLGAVRLGKGPRPRLRFDLAGAVVSFRDFVAERRVLPLRPRHQAPIPRPRRSQKGRR
jgi:hypothetical protein